MRRRYPFGAQTHRDNLPKPHQTGVIPAPSACPVPLSACDDVAHFETHPRGAVCTAFSAMNACRKREVIHE
jgi:hypothetical protein